MGHKLDANKLDSTDVEGIGIVRPGMELEHPIFGIGTVEAIYRFVRTGEITIRMAFINHGSKALVPQHANLSTPKPRKGVFGRLFGRGK